MADLYIYSTWKVIMVKHVLSFSTLVKDSPILTSNVFFAQVSVPKRLLVHLQNILPKIFQTNFK